MRHASGVEAGNRGQAGVDSGAGMAEIVNGGE